MGQANENTKPLAGLFLSHLREDTGPLAYNVICVRNASETDGGICHSHDFVDANMTMLRAFEEMLKVEHDIHNDAHSDLWNAAWNLAKAKMVEAGRELISKNTTNAVLVGLTHAEHSTVLAGLRYWQREGLTSSGHEIDIAKAHGREALSSGEIELLCGYVNMGVPPHSPAAALAYTGAQRRSAEAVDKDALTVDSLRAQATALLEEADRLEGITEQPPKAPG